MAKSIAAAVHQRQLTDQLAYQANHDALTGLPNRLMLQHKLDAALQDALKTGNSLAVVFVDLDRFKQINDTLGHEIGDVVLQQIASTVPWVYGPGTRSLAWEAMNLPRFSQAAAVASPSLGTMRENS